MTQSFNPRPYLCSELVSITKSGSRSFSVVVSGNLEAIGEWSAMILTDVPFKCGTEINIDANSNILRGTVECCEFEGPLGCYIEVRLAPESRWSEQWFKPEHMLAIGPFEPEKSSTKAFTLESTSGPEKFLHANFVQEWKVLPV